MPPPPAPAPDPSAPDRWADGPARPDERRWAVGLATIASAILLVGVVSVPFDPGAVYQRDWTTTGRVVFLVVVGGLHLVVPFAPTAAWKWRPERFRTTAYAVGGVLVLTGVAAALRYGMSWTIVGVAWLVAGRLARPPVTGGG